MCLSHVPWKRSHSSSCSACCQVPVSSALNAVASHLRNNFQRKLRCLILFQVHIWQVHGDCHPSRPALSDRRLRGTRFLSALPPTRAGGNAGNQFCSQQQLWRKRNQLSGAARSATSLRNEYFLICVPGMAPGLRTMLMDDVLMLLNVIFTEQGKL